MVVVTDFTELSWLYKWMCRCGKILNTAKFTVSQQLANQPPFPHSPIFSRPSCTNPLGCCIVLGQLVKVGKFEFQSIFWQRSQPYIHNPHMTVFHSCILCFILSQTSMNIQITFFLKKSQFNENEYARRQGNPR